MMMCGQNYKTVWNGKWKIARILEKNMKFMVKCRIFHCMEMLSGGGGGGQMRWYRQHNTIGHTRPSVQLSRVLYKTTLNRAVSLCFRQETTSIFRFFLRCFAREMRYPAPGTSILHPILHPKLPVNTGSLECECRKCSFFSKTFF